MVTGTLACGAPAYDFESWLASALLSVIFPFPILYAEFFKCCPLALPAALSTPAAVVR